MGTDIFFEETTSPRALKQPRDPTPQEIREACRSIQTEWSESERERRRIRDPFPWPIPEGGQLPIID